MNRSQHYIGVGRERAKQLPFAGEPIKFPECPKTFISDCTRCTKFLKNNQKRYMQRNELTSCLEPNKMIVEKNMETIKRQVPIAEPVVRSNPGSPRRSGGREGGLKGT